MLHHKTLLNRTTFFSVFLFLSGCIKPSIEFPTNELIVDVVVKADEEDMRVNAEFKHESAENSYKVSDEEVFIARVNDEERILARDKTLLYFSGDKFSLTINSPINIKNSFSGIFDGDYQNESISVEFDRANKQDSGLSSVTIPAASEIIAPVDGDMASLSLNNSILVSWSPFSLSEKVSLHFASSCELTGMLNTSSDGLPFAPILPLRAMTIEVDDTGSYSLGSALMIDFEKYTVVDDGNPETIESGVYASIDELDCQVDIYLTRVSDGEVGSEYGGGSIIAENTRKMAGSFRVTSNGWTSRVP